MWQECQQQSTDKSYASRSEDDAAQDIAGRQSVRGRRLEPKFNLSRIRANRLNQFGSALLDSFCVGLVHGEFAFCQSRSEQRR